MSEYEETADQIRMLAFRDILQFQPDLSTGRDAFEQIAIHARSTIIESQKRIGNLQKPIYFDGEEVDPAELKP
jgi:hypothetical protein